MLYEEFVLKELGGEQREEKMFSIYYSFGGILITCMKLVGNRIRNLSVPKS